MNPLLLEVAARDRLSDHIRCAQHAALVREARSAARAAHAERANCSTHATHAQRAGRAAPAELARASLRPLGALNRAAAHALRSVAARLDPTSIATSTPTGAVPLQPCVRR